MWKRGGEEKERREEAGMRDPGRRPGLHHRLTKTPQPPAHNQVGGRPPRLRVIFHTSGLQPPPSGPHKGT